MLSRAELVERVLRYQETSTRRLHLVPSENSLELAARLPMVTDLLHRYSFPTGNGENWAWPGNTDPAAIEAAACDGLRELYRARFVNIKPVSGLNAMTVALSALSGSGGTVASIPEADGGHGSTSFIAARFGQTVAELPFDRYRWSIDLDRLADLALTWPRPVLVYLDQFMCLFPHDLPGIRAAVGGDAVICYDGSHVMGLIAGGRFQDPLREGADVLCGSMHKTFPGPHKGILATDSAHLATAIDEHAGHWVSHHHTAEVAALAISVAGMRTGAVEYADRIVANARTLAAALHAGELAVCAGERGWTASHQLWVDIDAVLPAEQASARLLEAGIVVNAIDVPYLQRPGLRLGVQEATRLGMGSDAMYEIATVITTVLTGRTTTTAAARRVAALLDSHRHGIGQPGLEDLLEFLGATTSSEATP
ncbi:hypothetical protein [Nocardia sp. alder85J]|uniref:hypothetical protein n=1 Tax=Nocardia sp. alder85J TaxID=2862949 RepID=UPI001CD687C9|nr:hypothetical protein [Nocardia sp. alder85J]MCX4094565.1 hypothetical protein [Nocardia sp. alder85J]